MSRGLRLLLALGALVVFLVLLRTCASLEAEEGALGAEGDAPPAGEPAQPAADPAPPRSARRPASTTAPETPGTDGAVLVRLTDERGEPVASGALAMLWAPPLRGPADASWDRRVEPVVDGRARFEGVPLETTIRVRAMTDDYARATEQAERAGPGHPGEVIELALELPPRLPRIALRVVDEGGRPLANAALRLTQVRLPSDWDPFDVPDDGVRVTTDAEGRLEVKASPRPGAGARRFVVLRQGEPPHAARPARNPRSGVLELPNVLNRRGVTELGDCVLALEPLLVGGRVVDEEGRGIADAWVDVSFPGQGTSRNLARVFMPSRPIVDAQGRFEVRSREAPVEVQVGAGATGRRATSLRGLEPGASDVELVLSRSHAGWIEGRALVDAGVPLHLLEVRLRHQDGGRPRGKAFESVVGHFAIEDVEPGAVDLDFVIHAVGESLLALRGVQVPPDAASVDPRLAAVDLRGRVDVLRLRLLDARDRPIAGSDVEVKDQRGRGGEYRTDDEGRLTALVPPGALQWTVTVPGFAAAAVVLTREERVLRLSPW